MWVAINGTACWSAMLLWRQVVGKNTALCKYSYDLKNIPYEFKYYIKDIILLIEWYNLLWKDIVSFHIYSINSKRVGSSIINE